MSWILVCKVLKLIGHFIRHPVDVLLLPVTIFFGYFHGFIKVHAGLSLNVVSLMISFFPAWLQDPFRFQLSCRLFGVCCRLEVYGVWSGG